MGIFTRIQYNAKFLTTVIVPVIFCPLLLIEAKDEHGQPSTKFKCGYVMIVMAIYWMTEAIPLAIASLLPVVLLPVFGVLDTGEVSETYLKETNMMFLGGLIIALGMEYSNLHRRIALGVAVLGGTPSPPKLLFGVMSTTMFLSMWMSNTAATAMMLPIVMAVMDEIHETEKMQAKGVKAGNSIPRKTRRNSFIENPNIRNGDVITQEEISDGDEIFRRNSFKLTKKKEYRGQITNDEIGEVKFSGRSITFSSDSVQNPDLSVTMENTSNNEDEDVEEIFRKRRINTKKMYLFAIAYSSNIGGSGVLTGTPPNLAFEHHISSVDVSQGGIYLDMNFSTWFILNAPIMLLNTFLAYIYLMFIYFGIPDFLKFSKNKKTQEQISKENETADVVLALLKEQYKKLGKMTFHEMGVGILFILVVSLWFTRSPGFITGWGDIISNRKVGDSTAAIFVVCLLFVIPRDLNVFVGEMPETNPGSLLDWKHIQSNVPWGAILLLGGGFAISDASDKSGLSGYIGDQMCGLDQLHPYLILLVVMIITTLITQVTSNVASANILVPILIRLSKSIGLHPLYLTVASTVTCSYAFMLPVATPSNALVFAAGDITIMDMLKTGSVINVITILVFFLLNITYGELIFGYTNYEYPQSYNITKC